MRNERAGEQGHGPPGRRCSASSTPQSCVLRRLYHPGAAHGPSPGGVRQNIGGLFVTMNGGTIVEEMLAGAGLIRWLETTYLGMDGGMPVAYAIRRAIEQGEIELVEDWSNWSYAQRTLAGRLGLPFMPCMSNLASDLMSYDSFGKAACGAKRRTAPSSIPASPTRSLRWWTTPSRASACAPPPFACGEDTCGQSDQPL